MTDKGYQGNGYKKLGDAINDFTPRELLDIFTIAYMEHLEGEHGMSEDEAVEVADERIVEQAFEIALGKPFNGKLLWKRREDGLQRDAKDGNEGNG